MNVRSTLTRAAALAALLFACGAAHADPAALAGAKRALQSAVNRGRADAVQEARARLAAIAAAEPGSAFAHYWTAVADWRACPLVAVTDATKARRLADDGVAHCDAALAADPGFGEALALKGSLVGVQIQFGGGDVTSLGPQAIASLARARRLAPGNPRVLLLDGLNTLYRPKAFGGGADRALAILEQARDAFAKESVADSTAPDWGRDDAHAWLGQAYAELGRTDDARAAYARALEINPDHGYVRHVLLPRLDAPKPDGAKP